MAVLQRAPPSISCVARQLLAGAVLHEAVPYVNLSAVHMPRGRAKEPPGSKLLSTPVIASERNCNTSEAESPTCTLFLLAVLLQCCLLLLVGVKAQEQPARQRPHPGGTAAAAGAAAAPAQHPEGSSLAAAAAGSATCTAPHLPGYQQGRLAGCMC